MKFAALGNIIFLIAVFSILTLIPHRPAEESYVTFKISRHELPEKTSHESTGIYGEREEKVEVKTESEDLFPIDVVEKQEDSSIEKVPSEVHKAEKSIEKKSEAMTPEVVNAEEKRISDKALAEFAKLDNQSGLSDDAYFKQFVKIYNEAWVKGVHPQFRKDMVIRYYVKEEDGDAVFSLREFGYYIHERPTSERFNMLPSNALYYGNQVNVEDIKMVAYSLMSRGVTLKVIEPSQFSDDWKANSIEIGADDTILEEPNLSLAQLRKFRIK
jgi:hypothetical protein